MKSEIEELRTDAAEMFRQQTPDVRIAMLKDLRGLCREDERVLLASCDHEYRFVLDPCGGTQRQQCQKCGYCFDRECYYDVSDGGDPHAVTRILT